MGSKCENKGEYYVEKRENFKRSFGQEKLGSNFINLVNNGLKLGLEVQLLKVLGLPFLNKDVEQINNLDTNKDKILKPSDEGDRFSRSAFTFAMLNDHHAYAASETP